MESSGQQHTQNTLALGWVCLSLGTTFLQKFDKNEPLMAYPWGWDSPLPQAIQRQHMSFWYDGNPGSLLWMASVLMAHLNFLWDKNPTTNPST